MNSSGVVRRGVQAIMNFTALSGSIFRGNVWLEAFLEDASMTSPLGAIANEANVDAQPTHSVNFHMPVAW